MGEHKRTITSTEEVPGAAGMGPCVARGVSFVI